MKMLLKKRLNSPWIKSVDTAGVQGLGAGIMDVCDTCGSACSIRCGQFCMCPDPPYGDINADYTIESGKGATSLHDQIYSAYC